MNTRKHLTISLALMPLALLPQDTEGHGHSTSRRHALRHNDVYLIPKSGALGPPQNAPNTVLTGFVRLL
jgi:hypothetical protein